MGTLPIYNYGNIVYNYIHKQERNTPTESKEANPMKKFEIGQTYSMRSIGNQDCVWSYTVTARTAQTITITDGKETKRCRISKLTSEYRNAESIYPLGQYSMAPILSADKVA